MRTTAVLSVMALAGAVVAAPQSVFTRIGSGGYGYASAYNKQFDRNTLLTFNGRVSGIQVSAPEDGLGNLVTMLVKAPNGGTAMVEVGPEWYVDQQTPRVNVGDQVTVTGSKFIRNGRGVIYASQIQRGNRILSLRDYAGAPFWAAYRNTDQDNFAWEPIIEVVPTQQPVFIVPPVPVYGAPVISQRSGVIEAFTPYTPPNSDTVWVVMQLNTGASLIPVLLGPVWYMERQDVRIETGDLVNVNTIRPRGGMEYATSLTNANGYITLRSPADIPVWNGWELIPFN